MQNSKRINFFFLVVASLFVGCTTPSYRTVPWGRLKNEIITTHDRILLECEYISDYSGDLKNPHGFMIHILDEENTVFTVSQGNVLDKEDCFKSVNEIEKIVREGKVISIGGMGDLNEERQTEKARYLFPGLGSFHHNGRHLQFMMIWNEHHRCYDAQMGKGTPCPNDDFSKK